MMPGDIGVRPIPLTVVFLVSLLLVASCSDRTEGRFGADLYGVSCAGCHRTDGSGGTGPALTAGSAAASLSDEQLGDVIRVGPGSMPSFDKFTDEQIDSLVAHLRTLQTPGGQTP